MTRGSANHARGLPDWAFSATSPLDSPTGIGELFQSLDEEGGEAVVKVAGTIVRGFIDSPRWKKLNHSHLTVRRALDDVGTISASFWDVLIAETMRDSGVTRLYTENETDFRKIPWVEVLNPLRSPVAETTR